MCCALRTHLDSLAPSLSLSLSLSLSSSPSLPPSTSLHPSLPSLPPPSHSLPPPLPLPLSFPQAWAEMITLNTQRILRALQSPKAAIPVTFALATLVLIATIGVPQPKGGPGAGSIAYPPLREVRGLSLCCGTQCNCSQCAVLYIATIGVPKGHPSVCNVQ